MANERITLTGIRPPLDSIRPSGHHLRWAFPEQFGFPKFFVVYRRPSDRFKLKCIDLSKEQVPTGQVLASGSSLEGVSFHYSGTTQIRGNGENLTVNPASSNLLELRFSEPMAYVRINLGNVQGPVQLRAYAGSDLVATSAPLTQPSGTLDAEAPLITRVTIPLNFRTLAAICCVSMAADCQDPDWELIAELPLLKSVDEGLARLEADLRNRYVPDRARAVQRYERELEPLINWLKLLQDPTDPAFANPGANPDQLQLPAPEPPAPQPKAPVQFIRPQKILLLAAIDPNIARFLSLYWVDEYGARNGPEVNKSYDYKVEGRWQGREAGCGLVFGLGSKETGLPFVNKPIEGDQLPGFRWLDRNPLGRVGLRWSRLKMSERALRPVLFDLWRDPGTMNENFLTAKQPILVPLTAAATDNTALFVDANVPLGKHTYRLRPIDIFGQLGDGIDSEPIEVRDLEAPPPPVRLRASLVQPGYPWHKPEELDLASDPATLDLQFEFGDAQHRQAPDAKAFRLYWRGEHLSETASRTVQPISSQALQGNRKVHTVQVQDAAGLDLSSFVGGKLSLESATDSPLAAAERRHYQVDKQLSSDRLQLMPSENAFTKGPYRLVSDPHLRSNWTALSPAVQVRQPRQGLVEDAGVFQAVATKVQTLPPRSDPLAMLPAGHRPTTLAEPLRIVEIELDRRLLEPDIFNGGTLAAGGSTHAVLYSTGGLTSPARIGLPPGTTISSGAALSLRPAKVFQGTISKIERMPGGGLAITLPAQNNPAGTAHLIGGIVLIGAIAEIEKAKHTIINAREDTAGLRLELRPLVTLSHRPNILNDWLSKEATVTPPQVQALTIQGTVPDEVLKSPGGEIAFDVIKRGQPVTYVARIVSDSAARPNSFNLLVRLSSAALEALQPSTTRCRYYAPYRQKLKMTLPTTVGSTDSVTTLALPISTGESSQSAYLAVTTYDERENEGPLCSPVQVMAVKPPPSGAPGQPYPCGFDVTAEAGYATPPDRQGRATLCVAWDSGTLSSTAGLRYEVARALDNTILTAHRRNWMLNNVTLAPPLEAGPQVRGSLSNVTFDDARGLYRVTLTADSDGVEPALFRGGRLSQNGHYFQVTAAAAGSTGPLQLVVRKMGQAAPVNGTATLYAPPNYDAVRDDVAALRQLAATIPDAFSLVTGVPIAETEFTDEIPGIGRNCFFYRVRAVDGAENRSQWSPVSAPFHQVDTTPPSPPVVVSTLGLEKKAIMIFAPPIEPNTLGFAVFVSESDLRPEKPLKELFPGSGNGDVLENRKLRVLNGFLNLKGLGPETLDRISNLIAVHPLREDKTPDISQNLIMVGGTFDRDKSLISWSNSGPSHGTPVYLRYTDTQGNEVGLGNIPGYYEFVHSISELGPKQRRLTFWIQSIKRAALDFSGRFLKVYSEATKPVPVTAVDNELPSPPQWMDLRWIHDDQRFSAVLSWEVDCADAFYTLERRFEFSDQWHRVEYFVHPPRGTLTYQDDGVDPAYGYRYRLRVKVFEKENDAFNIGILNKVAEG
jgi:hypothetical protein